MSRLTQGESVRRVASALVVAPSSAVKCPQETGNCAPTGTLWPIRAWRDRRGGGRMKKPGGRTRRALVRMARHTRVLAVLSRKLDDRRETGA